MWLNLYNTQDVVIAPCRTVPIMVQPGDVQVINPLPPPSPPYLHPIYPPKPSVPALKEWTSPREAAKARVTGDFPTKCFYWEITFLRTKMFLPSVTVKKMNHLKLTTEQEILRRHVIGYGAPTVCSASNTCGVFQSDSCTALPRGIKQPSGSCHRHKGLVTLGL